MAHYAIYVPGLGDHRSYGQEIAIQLWRIFGLRPRYLPLGWNKKTGFKAKLNQLMHEVEGLKAAGHSVSLVGISAGASAVLNAYAMSEDIASIVCVCGKINNPQTLKESTFIANPDFKESLEQLNSSLGLLGSKKRGNIMSIHPWRDQTVPIADTIIEGAMEKTVPGWSHVAGIFSGIIFGFPSISRFIRSRA